MTDVSHEDLTAQIEAELARLQVADVLLHTVTTVASLAYRRLAEDEPDLAQVRLAIDAMRALVPLLDGAVPDDVLRDFRQAIANLQLTYADVAAPVS